MGIPSALIMELHPAVRELQHRVLLDCEVACSDEGASYFTDKIIEDIVTCLDHEPMALSNLYTYSARHKERLEEEGKSAEGFRMAEQIMDFGRDMFNELRHWRAYENGHLHYVYSGRCTPRTLILSRYD